MSIRRHFLAAVTSIAAFVPPALAGPTNVAPLGVATQSSTAYDGPQFKGSGPASRAIDGDTNGQYTHGSVSHTGSELGWWQVVLDQAYVPSAESCPTATSICRRAMIRSTPASGNRY